MDKDWVQVFSTIELPYCTIVQRELKKHDIESVILNKRDSFLLIGEIELYVKNLDFVKAKHLIDHFNNARLI